MAKQDPSKFMDKKYRDKVTNLEGIVTGVTYFHNGCVQLCIEPPVSDSGESREAKWIDEQRCEPTSGRKPEQQAGTGGGHAGTRR